MCGRYALGRNADQLALEFDVPMVSDAARAWEPSWNLKPTQGVPVVVEAARGDAEPVRRLEIARWSLVPSWSKTLTLRYPTFNARSETAASKPSFRASVKSRRALLPADGYYEWQTGPGGAKTPHFIHPADDEPLAFAGLYSWWADPTRPEDDDARWVLTATMLTSDAVSTLEDVHDREPVPLPAGFRDRWLDPGVPGDADLVHEAVEAALVVAGGLVHHPVAPLRGDGPALTAPRT